ncbi:MAG: HAD-IIIA family hydrolase [Phycisphaeraceae bacterium]|nr:HAD-IIIA family hydrolase [Phycisphaeraceae bacterium]
MQPAVFLDLDNTIIDASQGVPGAETVSLIKGAAPAIASLRGLGYRIVVAANHEGVARGERTEEDVHAIHARVAELVEQTANGAVIDAFYYCPFHPKGKLKKYKKDHPTRKPKPGMLEQAGEDLKLDLTTSWMIGDELADVQAGHAAGARTILLRPDAERLMPVDPASIEGVTAEPPDRERPTGPDFFAVSLVDAARLIAQQPRVEQTEAKAVSPDRKWDAEKIAKIQVPRPAKLADAPQTSPPAAVREFRPWGAPTKQEGDDAPIVAKPFRKRHQAEAAVAEQAGPPAEATTQPAPTPPPAPTIPEPIRQAKERKQAAASQSESDSDKTLRMILHELRAQRGKDQEFTFLAIVAVALQLVAVVCLLGGLFMGGDNDGIFLRWLGAGVMAQLTAIATLLYGR